MHEFRGFVAIHESFLHEIGGHGISAPTPPNNRRSFLRENLISAKLRKFSPLKVSRHTVLLYAILHVTKRETDSGWNSGYYAAILSGKNIAVNGA